MLLKAQRRRPDHKYLNLVRPNLNLRFLILILIDSRNGRATAGDERAAAAGGTNESVLEGVLSVIISLLLFTSP